MYKVRRNGGLGGQVVKTYPMVPVVTPIVTFRQNMGSCSICIEVVLAHLHCMHGKTRSSLDISDGGSHQGNFQN